jgi:DeoR/GlpR family transcriptional regulator of sugar metabolism
MLTRQRQKFILDTLRDEGQVVAKTLALQMAVSEDTLRRDLRELARKGLLQRVHGGALPVSRAIVDISARASVLPAEKEAIARAAAGMLRAGQVALLDGGTTAVRLARLIDPALRATIVTHSPSVAVELVEHACEVILIGGRLFKHSMVSVGVTAVQGIGQVRPDICFLGVTGLHPDVGLTTGDVEEAAVKRAMISAAAETIVLASSEKVGAASSYVIAPVSAAASAIVTDAAPPETLARLADLGLEIVRAR